MKRVQGTRHSSQGRHFNTNRKESIRQYALTLIKSFRQAGIVHTSEQWEACFCSSLVAKYSLSFVLPPPLAFCLTSSMSWSLKGAGSDNERLRSNAGNSKIKDYQKWFARTTTKTKNYRAIMLFQGEESCAIFLPICDTGVYEVMLNTICFCWPLVFPK